MSGQLRDCIGCGQVDDHPRDIRTLRDGSEVYWHHDCLARTGDPASQWLVAHKGDLVGDEWRDHVMSLHESLSDEQRELPPHERDVVESHRDGAVKTTKRGR